MMLKRIAAKVRLMARFYGQNDHRVPDAAQEMSFRNARDVPSKV